MLSCLITSRFLNKISCQYFLNALLLPVKFLLMSSFNSFVHLKGKKQPNRSVETQHPKYFLLTVIVVGCVTGVVLTAVAIYLMMRRCVVCLWGGALQTRGPFLESPENFAGPKSHLWTCQPLVQESRSFKMFSRKQKAKWLWSLTT